MKTTTRYGTPEERFWRYVNKDGAAILETQCWEWTGATFRFGYGQLSVRHSPLEWRPAYAHRFSYEMHVGPIPSGLFVCHRCDNPACVRPDHLFLGTHRENMADAHRKGRLRKRNSAHQEEAARLRAQGLTYREIGERLGVSDSWAQKLVRGA